jgi:pimeloyl-ACP methyl ester carboxylesterase
VRFVDTGGLRLAYRESGSGEPVLLIQGTGESSFTYLPLMRALSARWRCVAFDARDTGSSSYVDDAYTPADLARDAAGVIDGLGLGACHVVGFSLGGATAQELALARPELVRSLVLLSTWARSDEWFRAQMRSWQTIRLAHPGDDYLADLEAWLLSPATMEDADLRARIHAAWHDDLPEQRADGWVRQCDADIAHDTAGRLPSIDAPALVIVGGDDLCTPPRFAVELFELIPDAELVTIPDAGHCAVFERPDAVAGVIGDFLGAR